MTLEGADALISSHLVANWPHTPIAWGNVEPRAWTQPGQPLLPEGDDDFLIVRSELVRNQTVTVPATCVRSQVQYLFSVCVKQGTGTRQAKKWLDHLVDLMENVTLRDTDGTLRVSTMIGSVGYAAENGWHVEEASFMVYFERHTPARGVA
jgi:hypothetical protein